jgi:tRNA pseudouridine55 synthase
VESKTTESQSSALPLGLDGVLVIDKARGPTSSDVVLQVKRLLKMRRVGHTGTLDPLATGVLPLCLGRATRLSIFLSDQDKSYRAQVRLGIRTDTGDSEGKVVSERPVPPLNEEGLERALRTLRGPQMQTPPMYSAVKMGGRKLYELARQGKQVERTARPIEVHELALEEWRPTLLTLRIRCSKGTYVRVLAEDLGERLGCGAHLTELRRLQSGPFDIADAISVEDLSMPTHEERRERVARALVPMAEALGGMHRIMVDTPEAAALRASGRVPMRDLTPPAGLVALVDPDGDLVAVAHGDGRVGLKLRRVFPRG